MDLDVRVLHGRPGHPQTQGKQERFHRTLKQEVLQGRAFADLSVAPSRFDPWRAMYNQERPHEALGLDVPSSRYRVSARRYRAEVLQTPFVYDVSFTVRRVREEGRIRLGGKDSFVGGAYGGRRIGLRRGREDGVWEVYYRTFRVATLSERTRRVISASVRDAHSSGRHPVD